MKTLKTLFALGVAALLAGSASAQPKIGLIDLQKVFDGYYKTKAADALIQDQKADFLKQKKTLMDQYERAGTDYKKALEESNNQAVSADEREKRKKGAENSLLEVKRLEDQINQFERSAGTTLEEKLRRMRESILDEIRAVVNARAKAGQYTMVLDTAAESFNKTPIVLYNNGENDLTATVLQELNRGQPTTSSLPTVPAADIKGGKK